MNEDEDYLLQEALTSYGTYDEQTYRTLRAMRSCLYTMRALTDALHDPGYAEARADILLAAEDLAEYGVKLAKLARDIAWNDTDPEAERTAHDLEG